MSSAKKSLYAKGTGGPSKEPNSNPPPKPVSYASAVSNNARYGTGASPGKSPSPHTPKTTAAAPQATPYASAISSSIKYGGGGGGGPSPYAPSPKKPAAAPSLLTKYPSSSLPPKPPAMGNTRNTRHTNSTPVIGAQSRYVETRRADGLTQRVRLEDPSAGDARRFYIQIHSITGGGIPIPHMANGLAPPILRRSGSRTVADPEILWTCAPYKRDKHNTLAEAAARAAAREANCPCIVIRAKAHENMTLRAQGGTQRLTTIGLDGTADAVTERCDWHLTVYLGESERKMQLQGHIFVYDPNDSYTPLELIRNPNHRNYPRSANLRDKDYYEYWRMRGTQYYP